MIEYILNYETQEMTVEPGRKSTTKLSIGLKLINMVILK
jgi:hypothetical protein